MLEPSLDDCVLDAEVLLAGGRRGARGLGAGTTLAGGDDHPGGRQRRGHGTPDEGDPESPDPARAAGSVAPLRLAGCRPWLRCSSSSWAQDPPLWAWGAPLPGTASWPPSGVDWSNCWSSVVVLVLVLLLGEVAALAPVVGPAAGLATGPVLLGGVGGATGLRGDPDRDRGAERADGAGGDHAASRPRRTPDLLLWPESGCGSVMRRLCRALLCASCARTEHRVCANVKSGFRPLSGPHGWWRLLP